MLLPRPGCHTLSLACVRLRRRISEQQPPGCPRRHSVHPRRPQECCHCCYCYCLQEGAFCWQAEAQAPSLSSPSYRERAEVLCGAGQPAPAHVNSNTCVRASRGKVLLVMINKYVCWVTKTKTFCWKRTVQMICKIQNETHTTNHKLCLSKWLYFWSLKNKLLPHYNSFGTAKSLSLDTWVVF